MLEGHAGEGEVQGRVRYRGGGGAGESKIQGRGRCRGRCDEMRRKEGQIVERAVDWDLWEGLLM